MNLTQENRDALLFGGSVTVIHKAEVRFVWTFGLMRPLLKVTYRSGNSAWVSKCKMMGVQTLCECGKPFLIPYGWDFKPGEWNGR